MEIPEYPRLIALAIPGFVILILVELFFVWRRKRDYYRFNDSIGDLSAGIFQQVLGIFSTLLLYGIYHYLETNFGLIDITLASPWVWVLCFLLVDHQYYWFHRLSHEINFIWASHVPHHSSEEYNLTVALRQGAIQGLFSFPFYIPLALLGFPFVMFVVLSQLNTLYQFWIHTREMGKLWRPFEFIFNTPSNHRVHHGINPQYIDKNHAGTLMIWDRMYGTFVDEDEPVVYGITNPLNTWSPLWAQTHYWVEIFRLSMAAPRWRDKILVWFKEPGWMPEGMGPHKKAPPVSIETYQKFDTKSSKGMLVYIGINFVLTIGLLNVLLYTQKYMVLYEKLFVCFMILFALVNMAGLLESNRRQRILEPLRLLLLGLGGLYILSTGLNLNNLTLLYAGGVATGFLLFIPWIISLARFPVPEINTAR